MNIIHFFDAPVFKALGIGLMYSLVQALIIYVLMKLILAVIRNASANIKYTIAYISLMVTGILFAATFIKYIDLAGANADKLIVPVSLNPADVSQIATVAAMKTAEPQGVMFYINKLQPWFLLIYCCGVIVFAVRFINNYRRIVFLKSTGLIAPDNDLKYKCRCLTVQMHITAPPTIFLSEHVHAPVMIGYLKPVILLPVAFVNNLSVEETEAILLHELAHISRKDYLFNLLQTVIETILFFNPFVWCISKIVRREREKACDEIVVEYTKPVTYANALLSLENGRKPALTQAANDNRFQLLNRIKNFTMEKNNMINAKQKMVSLLIIITGIFSIAWFSPKQQNHDPEIIVKKQEINKSPVFTFADSPVIRIKTSVLPTTPKLPLQPASPKINNVPEVAKVPPAPPVPPRPDIPSLATMPVLDSPPALDSAKVAAKMREFYNSKKWKKFQDDLKTHTAKISNFYKSDAWKKYQRQLKENTAKIQHFYNSDSWKKYQKDLQANAAKIRDYYKSDAWKKYRSQLMANAEQLRKQAEEYRKSMNSAQWQQQQKDYRLKAEEFRKQAETFRKKFNADSMNFQTDKFRQRSEEFRKKAEEFRKQFDSPEWKKQQQDIQKQAQDLGKYFQSDEWKNEQDDIQKQVRKLQDDLNKTD